MRYRLCDAQAALVHVAQQRHLFARGLTTWVHIDTPALGSINQCPELQQVVAPAGISKGVHSRALQLHFNRALLRSQMHTRSKTIRVSHLAGETLDSCQRRFLQFESFKAYSPVCSLSYIVHKHPPTYTSLALTATQQSARDIADSLVLIPAPFRAVCTEGSGGACATVSRRRRNSPSCSHREVALT